MLKTLKGYEAIEIAERYDVALYDLHTQRELTSEQARELVRQRGMATTCVIEAWPETDEEAEQIVLKVFQQILNEQRRATAALEELLNEADGRELIHPKAVELASLRLVDQGRLLLVEEHPDMGSIFAIPRTIYFTEEFLDKLTDVVCEDCARLDVSGAFHEDCLFSLIEFIKTYDFSLDDLKESTAPVEMEKNPRGGRQVEHQDLPALHGMGVQWLQKTAHLTKTGWNTVLRPMFKHRLYEDDLDLPENRDVKSEAARAPHVHTDETNGPLTMEASELQDRPQITKKELIRYLQHVEILDDGELTLLQMDRENLRTELARKDAEIRKLEQQRAYLESQFNEMQRDMDTLVRAMRIAKRYEPSKEQVIDAVYQSGAAEVVKTSVEE